MIIILCHLTQTLNIFELFIFWFNYSFFFTVFNLICFFFLSWHFTPVFFFFTENYSGMIIPFRFLGKFLFFFNTLRLGDLGLFLYLNFFREENVKRELFQYGASFGSSVPFYYITRPQTKHLSLKCLPCYNPI